MGLSHRLFSRVTIVNDGVRYGEMDYAPSLKLCSTLKGLDAPVNGSLLFECGLKVQTIRYTQCGAASFLARSLSLHNASTTTNILGVERG